MTDYRDCTSCKGTGVNKAAVIQGVTYGVDRPCSSCNATGKFAAPDETAIREAIKGRKGLRSAAPKNNHRAYYVWRMARFHGGVDVTMPVMAQVYNHGDPYLDELDKLADTVAKESFGSNMAAALAWGRALGRI
jgi:hypothetical protein